MLDRLEDRLLLSADGSFPPAVDTSQDGLFEPFDALILLNAVNSNIDVLDAPHLDLNEDGALSVADVDLIIGSLSAYYGGYWDADSIAALDDSQVSITDVTVAEGETAEITVSLAQSVSEWTEVMVWSENGTATEYDDFTSTYTYLSFYPGDPLSQTVSIPTFVDANDEADEVFFVRASGSWQTGFEAVGTVVVQDTALTLPALSVGDVTVTEGQSATITLTLDSAPATEMFVTFWTTEGSAIMYEDYEGLSTDFYWYPGDPLSKTVTLHTYTDSHSEGDETLTVHADIRPSSGSVAPVESTATVTILDDGTGGSGGPTITVGDVTVDEGNPAELNVSVSGPVTESIYLHAWTTDGTADYLDYGSASPTTFRFDPGGPTSYLVTVPTIADGIGENDETFTVHIEDQSTYQGPTATVTILDQDGGGGGGGTTPGFSVSDVTVVEGDMAIVTVTLDAAPTSSLYLDAYTQSVTAYEYEDYDYTSAYLNFNPGDPLTQTISIPTHGDNRNEGDETFEVIVSDNATYQSVTSTVTIQDVAPPTISVSGDTVSEGDVATVTVRLSAAPAAPLYLYVSSQSGTATEYEDYEYVGSYLTFHPDDPLTQTVEIQTHGDNTAEDDETFEVVVSNSETYESVTSTVTIQDVAPPTISVSDVTVLEGETALVAIALSEAPVIPLHLSITTESTGGLDSALPGFDYEELSISIDLTFLPGESAIQTIEINTLADSENEDDEWFRVVAANSENYETYIGVITIADIACGPTSTLTSMQQAACQAAGNPTGKLKSVAFEDDHKIKEDPRTYPLSDPEWVDDNLDGTAEKQWPAAYTRASTMKASGTIVLGAPWNGPVYVKASGGGLNLTAPNPVNVNGTSISATLTASLPNTVKHYDNLDLKWEVSFDGGLNFSDVGTSSNDVYLTLADPIGSPIYHTSLHIGSHEGNGQTTEEGVLGKVRSHFESRAVKTVGGKELSYYESWTCGGTSTYDLLNTGDGACGTWANFFISVANAQGIKGNENYIEIAASQATGFLVKEWNFDANGGTAAQAVSLPDGSNLNQTINDYPYLNVYGVNSQYPNGVLDTLFDENAYMFKSPNVTSVNGIAGQGPVHNPLSMFIAHAFVQYDFGEGLEFFDPSYGKKYTGETLTDRLKSFENGAIAGFYIEKNMPIIENVLGHNLNGNNSQQDTVLRWGMLIKKNDPTDIELKITQKISL